MHSRVYSTESGAKRIKLKESRLREMTRNGYINPDRLANNVLAWRAVELEVVRLCAEAIDAGAPHYCVRLLAARLTRLDSAEAVRSYAAGCALVEDQGLWKLLDASLDSDAMRLATMASRKITFNTEEK